MRKGITKEEFPAHFWAKVNMPAVGCWEWQASKTGGGGYGAVGVNGKSTSAHRVSYELFYGPILNNLLVRHTCDNPSCVRPDHLTLGTYSDNMRDRTTRNRCNSANGAKLECKRGHALTPENVRITKIGSRQCLACHKIMNAEGQKSRREKQKAQQ
jgi:hypothetical protein